MPAKKSLAWDWRWGVALLLSVLLSDCYLLPQVQVVSAAMCTQVNASDEPLDTTTHYSADASVLHCVVQVRNAQGHRVRAVYIAEDAIDTPNYVIDALEVSANGSHAIDFPLRRDERPWPTGRYRVEVYLDGALVRTVPFVITGSTPIPSSTATMTPTATPMPPTPTLSPTPPLYVAATLARGPQESLQELGADASYAPDEAAFYCLVHVRHASPETEIKVRWIALDAMPQREYLLQEADYFVSGNERIAFQLPREGAPWPVGRYRVEVYVADQRLGVQDFEVHAEQ